VGRCRRPGPRPRARATAALATAVLALVAGCTVGVRPDPADRRTSGAARPAAGAATSTGGPVARGNTVASRAFTLVRVQQGGRIRPVSAGAMPLALRRTGDAADQAVNLVLVFPLLEAPPRCVRQVELWLRLLRFDQQFRYQDPQLGAYPSQLVSLASVHPVSRVGFETLLDNRPSGSGERARDGSWMRFDITELYRTWAEGGPFPSQERTIRPGTPLVVDVRATDFGQPLFEARVAPVRGDRSAAPQLRWTARDC